jgi:hypothetical protein
MMRARLARLAMAASLLGGGLAFMSGGVSAHAMTCDPDYPCDPPPTTIPKPTKPTVTFGCGTVTVSTTGKSVTAHILPCPGPVLF